MTTIRDIDSALEAWAPGATAESYDNVGLQVGRSSAVVTKCLVALDLIPQVIDEALSLGAQLIITHHPLLFRPLKRLSDDTLVSTMALSLAEAGIAHYAIHTNLDKARGGVSFELASRLGLQNIRFLGDLRDSIVKLAIFVPVDSVDAVRDAAHAAGGGQIGAYSHCSFSHGGTGQYLSGKSGSTLQRVNEVRLELEVARWRLRDVVASIKDVHPYEEVAYDVVALEQSYRDAGLGALGELSAPVSLSEFMNSVCASLANPALRFAGDPDSIIRRVAVCGGSGSEFLPLARKAGADAFVSADVTYHRFFEVLDICGRPDMALIDAGHYETEQMSEALLVRWLSARFPGVEWTKTTVRTSPVHTWIGQRE